MINECAGESASAPSLVISDADASLGFAEYYLTFRCGSSTTDRRIAVNYTAKCSPNALRSTLERSLRQYCVSFPVINGPYLCTQQRKREVYDILNLSFAAGATVSLLATMLAKAVHRLINPVMVVDGVRKLPSTHELTSRA